MYPHNRGGPPPQQNPPPPNWDPQQPSGSAAPPGQPQHPDAYPRPPSQHLPPPSQIPSPHHPQDGRPDMTAVHGQSPYRLPAPHEMYRPPPPNPYGSQPPQVQYAQPQPAPRQRTAIACRYCRRRKIRCSGFDASEDGRCTNCVRFSQECIFMPVASQTQAFVPAHTVWRGNGQPPQLYGAYGQPLQGPQPQTPPHHPSQDPYAPGRHRHPHRPPTPPQSYDAEARRLAGYPPPGSHPPPPPPGGPYYAGSVGSSNGGGDVSHDGRKRSGSGSSARTSLSIGYKRSAEEAHTPTIAPPNRASWSSAQSHHLPPVEIHRPASSNSTKYSHPLSEQQAAVLHHPPYSSDRTLTPLVPSPGPSTSAYPPPPQHQQHPQAQSPYYTAPHQPPPVGGPPPPRHASPQQHYGYDNRTSTSPLANPPSTPYQYPPPGPAADPHRQSVGPPRQDGSTPPPRDSSSSSRPGMSIRDIVSDPSGGRSSADSQMLNALNRRPM